MGARLLVVDDDPSSCEMLDEGLSARGFTVVTRGSVDDAIAALDAGPRFDAVLTDVRMPRRNGLELLKHAVENQPDVPVVVVTAFGSIDTAVEAVRAGAYDFLTKPFDLDVIALALSRATQHAEMGRELDGLRSQAARAGKLDSIVGTSPPMRRVFELVERVAALDSTVLITGESGTGKELVARALHRRGPRSKAPFVAVNCAAIPDSLLESELFGHARGAFTDARSDRAGLMARASSGTLFLDEIGDMNVAMQAKLLRVLQERKIRPIGSDSEIPFDARVVAATHQDLEALMNRGAFRQDLFYRLNVIEVAVPPLRVRGNDVLELAHEFAAEFARRFGRAVPRITPEAASALLSYAWPGNVRELQNCMERALAMADGGEITPRDLPDRVAAPEFTTETRAEAPDELVSLEVLERRHIRRVLAAVKGNKTLAAQILGLDRSTLYRKLDRDGEPEPEPR